MTLDGSGSYDDDNDTLTYTWELISVPLGSGASLSDTTAVKPTFTADANGDYTARLTVSDGNATTTDEVLVSFNNVPPAANAGGNQAAVVGDVISLDPSGSSDANGDAIVSYAWSFDSKPAGSYAAIISCTPGPGVPVGCGTFTADVAGDYVVSLIVNDGLVDSAPDTITVTVVTAQDAASTTLVDTVETINELDPVVLKNPNLVNALTNKINSVLTMIEDGDYDLALNKLQTDILGKTDGCANEGAPDSNDWIDNCPEQAQVYQFVLDAISYLETLTGG